MFGVGGPLGLLAGEAGSLHAEAVARKPLRRDLLAEPLGRNHRQIIQGRPEGFPHTFQTIQCADRGQDLRRIRPSPAARSEEATGLEAFQEGLQEKGLGLPSYESGAKLCEAE